ncbi:hypothetical protein BDV12DRAFT_199371 [Aspergillus spectabilis]
MNGKDSRWKMTTDGNHYPSKDYEHPDPICGSCLYKDEDIHHHLKQTEQYNNLWIGEHPKSPPNLMKTKTSPPHTPNPLSSRPKQALVPDPAAANQVSALKYSPISPLLKTYWRNVPAINPPKSG